MATIASQVILHPTLTQSLKLLYRAVQYLARFIAWFLVRRGATVEAARWEALKTALGSGRKLIRLGKPLEHLQAAMKATQLRSNPGERITAIGRQLSYAGFLTYDAIVWANSIKFYKLDAAKAQKYARLSFQFWLSGILFSIGNGFLKSRRLTSDAQALKRAYRSEKDVGRQAERDSLSRALQAEQAAVKSQFKLDIIDLWIPASGLQLVNLNDGIVGLLGLTTSYLALKAQWLSLNAKN
ncbi:peroxisomal biogenesis factor 11 [Sistotremastrum niveocremeum HHB9708]|uniref:Peroxisomal biogenesis factor 11 n=1 Tax=Sistotremastrum niveocremeum HHB9708 TaxID=1314777 RepID=A0A164UR41_9AGAM|nr:peroxisomal biogenesis factor 11 [Sistotremastrum niveocremeum HHB9708]